jgi:hypothetical protein
MFHIVQNRPQLTWVIQGALAIFVLAGIGNPHQSCARADAVDELRQALPLRLEELGNPTQNILDFRRETLQKRVDKLRTIGELRRALALEEWKENPNQVLTKVCVISTARCAVKWARA